MDRARALGLAATALAGLLAGAAVAAAAQAPVATASPAPVAARVIPRGAVLVADDIAPVAGVPDTGRRVAPGWIARRRIDLGEPLRPPAVVPPMVVQAGDTVLATLRQDGVALTVRAVALGAAAVGDRLAVRLDVHRRFEGILIAPRQVQLP